ncbi:MAG: GDP-L-fucose synthase [Verrucomicrobia bacterium]|nr:GDP-L-fucose synthase [Verrucomicrobiota bacterium]
MNLEATIFVAGADTLIGGAIVRQLRRQGCARIAGVGANAPDLTDANAVEAFFARTKPAYVFMAAGKSGGISANQKYPADLMLNNLQVIPNVLAAAHRHGVAKLLYLASSCVYPKQCPQPMSIASLMAGPMEPTSEPYAMAKMAGIKLCQAYRQQHGAHFISGIPADVFGPGCRFSAEDSHVVPALIVKMHEAKKSGKKSVELWGTGNPRREFTYADDLADACLLLMRDYDGAEPVNIGSGEAVSIRDVAELIKETVGYGGRLRFDTSKPDGAPIKWLDSAPLRALGWQPRTPLREALSLTYQSFLTTLPPV